MEEFVLLTLCSGMVSYTAKVLKFQKTVRREIEYSVTGICKTLVRESYLGKFELGMSGMRIRYLTVNVTSSV